MLLNWRLRVTTTIQLMHARSGLARTGFYGFSGTSLCFGGVPAIARGDVVMGLGICLIGGVFAFLVALGLGPLGLPLGWLVVGGVWGSVYNRIYTTRLIARGYKLADSDENNARAQRALGLQDTVAVQRAG
jgi:hypothetical protein